MPQRRVWFREVEEERESDFEDVDGYLWVGLSAARTVARAVGVIVELVAGAVACVGVDEVRADSRHCAPTTMAMTRIG